MARFRTGRVLFTVFSICLLVACLKSLETFSWIVVAGGNHERRRPLLADSLETASTPATLSAKIPATPAAPVPYYLDKYSHAGPLHNVTHVAMDVDSKANSNLWWLRKKLHDDRRNHDCLIFDQAMSGPLMVNLLGRYARSVEAVAMLTGDVKVSVTHGVDPDGRPLNDLNHVYATFVEKLDKSGGEIWLPCGFHGDEVDGETSSSYVRIVDPEDLSVRSGPQLQRAGGACSSLPLHLDGPESPAHICVFGGTDGKHDTGTYLDTVACYDRVREIWSNPLGTLPTGLDHSNAVHVKRGLCGKDQPEMVLITNFRSSNYGPATCDVWAFNLDDPHKPSGREWYMYSKCPKTWTGRDAAGIALADGGRLMVTLGGVHYYKPKQGKVFSDIAGFDICTKEFSVIGDIGVERFALQSCASAKLNVVVTCGGQPGWKHMDHLVKHKAKHNLSKIVQSLFNHRYCSVNTLPDHSLDGTDMGGLVLGEEYHPRERLFWRGKADEVGNI